jgi:hypothetical protein
MRSEDHSSVVDEHHRSSINPEDPILAEWLQRRSSGRSHRPLSSWPPRGAADADREPLGDIVADAWFL